MPCLKCKKRFECPIDKNKGGVVFRYNKDDYKFCAFSCIFVEGMACAKKRIKSGKIFIKAYYFNEMMSATAFNPSSPKADKMLTEMAVDLEENEDESLEF